MSLGPKRLKLFLIPFLFLSFILCSFTKWPWHNRATRGPRKIQLDQTGINEGLCRRGNQSSLSNLSHAFQRAIDIGKDRWMARKKLQLLDSKIVWLLTSTPLRENGGLYQAGTGSLLLCWCLGFIGEWSEENSWDDCDNSEEGRGLLLKDAHFFFKFGIERIAQSKMRVIYGLWFVLYSYHFCFPDKPPILSRPLPLPVNFHNGGKCYLENED